MNADIRDRWVAELESGKWRKAKSVMGRGKRQRCCLGVLAEMYAEEHGFTTEVSSSVLYIGATSCAAGSSLPWFVEEWAGIDLNTCVTLAELNDSKPGYPIEAIKNL